MKIFLINESVMIECVMKKIKLLLQKTEFIFLSLIIETKTMEKFASNFDYFHTAAPCHEVMLHLKPAMLEISKVISFSKKTDLKSLKIEYSVQYTRRFLLCALFDHLKNSRFLLAETYVSYILKMHETKTKRAQEKIDNDRTENFKSLCYVFESFDEVVYRNNNDAIACEEFSIMTINVLSTSRSLPHRSIDENSIRLLEQSEFDLSKVAFVSCICNHDAKNFVKLHENLEKHGYEKLSHEKRDKNKLFFFRFFMFKLIVCNDVYFLHQLFDQFGFNMKNSSIFDKGVVDIVFSKMMEQIVCDPMNKVNLFTSFFAIPGMSEHLQESALRDLRANRQFIAVKLMCALNADFQDLQRVKLFTLFLENKLFDPNQKIMLFETNGAYYSSIGGELVLRSLPG